MFSLRSHHEATKAPVTPAMPWCASLGGASCVGGSGALSAKPGAFRGYPLVQVFGRPSSPRADRTPAIGLVLNAEVDR